MCFILSLIRACLLTYYICVIIPNIISIYMDTWFLNTINWWVSKNEPFFTNESVLNAFICWIIWCYIMITIQIILYIYLPLFIIVGLYFIIRFLVKNGFGALSKGFFIFFYYVFCCVKNIIIGRAVRAFN